VIVADTSALVSLAVADVLVPVSEEFRIATTETVRTELAETVTYDDAHARAAEQCLEAIEGIAVEPVEESPFESARVDEGEGSCVLLVEHSGAEYLVTDDLRALPELQTLSHAEVVISPFLVAALVRRGVLGRAEALQRLETVADTRSWLGAPIYRRARSLLDDPEE